MNPMKNTKIKICGISRECDIACVNECKPDFIGFVFAKSRRQVSVQRAAELKKLLSPQIKAVGVFVNSEEERIAELVQSGVIDIVQLHGQEDENYLRRLKSKCRCPIIRAISVGKDEISAYSDSEADYLLLDNGSGGTGKTFDWSLDCSIVTSISKPFFLAGGLNAENVCDGIRKFSPFAADISGGVETDGFKDPAKIREIIRRIRNEYE